MSHLRLLVLVDYAEMKKRKQTVTINRFFFCTDLCLAMFLNNGASTFATQHISHLISKVHKIFLVFLLLVLRFWGRGY